MGKEWGVVLEGVQHDKQGRVPRLACLIFQLGIASYALFKQLEDKLFVHDCVEDIFQM